MEKKINMPKLAPEMESGVLCAWLKEEGESVAPLPVVLNHQREGAPEMKGAGIHPDRDPVLLLREILQCRFAPLAGDVLRFPVNREGAEFFEWDADLIVQPAECRECFGTQRAAETALSWRQNERNSIDFPCSVRMPTPGATVLKSAVPAFRKRLQSGMAIRQEPDMPSRVHAPSGETSSPARESAASR